MSIPSFHPRAPRVSGASAEQRHRLQSTLASVPSQAGGVAPSSFGPTRRLGLAVLDAITVLAGLFVFGSLAYFLLIL